MVSSKKPWTEPELTLLCANYASSLTGDIATVLKRSATQVYNKAALLGLKKSKAFIADQARSSLARESHGAHATRFTPGHIPFNKGRKGWCAPGSEVSHFPKGHVPANHCEVGTLRINGDGGLDIKLAEGMRQWVQLSHYAWFLEHGEWPAHGMCIRFIDGDIHNTQIENLRMITRKENMRLNSVHTLMPPELAKLVQLRGALNRQINRRMKEQIT